VFKDGAQHGKDRVFRSFGYDKTDSQALASDFERQASTSYASGDYTLGKLDQYGQRIDIVVDLHGQGVASGRSARIVTAWMVRADGSITLNTPFSGFEK
jgi:hypothetical protein